MLLISRSDVTFYIATIGGILAILAVLWKALLSRLATKEELMRLLAELKDYLKDYLNEHFVRKK
jgi:hypothetical protein